MKMFNKQILEAINRGINLALDDVEDSTDIQQQSYGKIKNDYNTKDYIIWSQLWNKFDEGRELLSKEELNTLSRLSLKFGYTYKFDNKIYLSDAIDYVCRIDPTCNLNWFDISELDNLDFLFSGTYNCKKFIGDISKWNVSNVKSMAQMFKDSKFNGDISQWDIANVTDFRYMFLNSEFKQDLSNWPEFNDNAVIDGMFGNAKEPYPIKYMPKFIQEQPILIAAAIRIS